MSSTRRETFSFIGLEEYDELEPLWCPYCTKVNVFVKLQPRVYPEGELPADADSWLQCYRCGKKVWIEQGQEEGEYSPIVDLVDSPYESGSEFTSPDRRVSKPKRNKLTKTKMNKILEREISTEEGVITIHVGDD